MGGEAIDLKDVKIVSSTPMIKIIMKILNCNPTGQNLTTVLKNDVLMLGDYIVINPRAKGFIGH